MRSSPILNFKTEICLEFVDGLCRVIWTIHSGNNRTMSACYGTCFTALFVLFSGVLFLKKKAYFC